MNRFGTLSGDFTRLDFTKSMPLSASTFDEYQKSRSEKMNAINNDIQAEKEAKLKEMRKELQELILSVNVAQSELTNEEHEFIKQKEALITEIKKVDLETEKKIAEAKHLHRIEMDDIRSKQENALRAFSKSIQSLEVENESFNDDKEIDDMKEQVREYESKLSELKFSQRSSLELDNSVYSSKLYELESKKRELTQILREEEQKSKTRLMEMTILLDEQDSQFQNKISQMQNSMKKKEEQYQRKISKLMEKLQDLQQQRFDINRQRKAKVSELQKEIENIETEFKQKLTQASRVAEKLKISLSNINLRKSQQLSYERERSLEQQELLKESYLLQQQIAKLEQDLQKAKSISSNLRRELSARIGARRVASLLL